MNMLEPQEGRWYEFRGNHELFQIINIDEAERVIYYQDAHGDIDEIDMDEWPELDVEFADEEEPRREFESRQEDEDEYAPQRHARDDRPGEWRNQR